MRFCSPHRRRAHPGRRAGAVLPLALVVLTLLLVLSLGGAAAATQSFRAGRNLLVEQRAFTVAEYGLNREISNWRRSRNLPAPTGMAIGATDDSSVYVAAGDTARVRVTRLTPMTFWVVSTGRAAIGRPAITAQRTTSAFMRLAYPAIKARAAVTVGGGIDISGSALVDGRNTPPAGWAQCDSLGGPDAPAVLAPPGAAVSYKSKNIPSTPPVTYDPLAADSNTFVRFGTESWASLQANADVKLQGGGYGKAVGPTLTGAGACDYGNQFNWGEPTRGSGAVTACQNYFPIIYVDGDLSLNGNGYGQGILLVNGSLSINGTFSFTGLVIVRDDLNKANGAATITGSVLARNAVLTDGASYVTGNQTVTYSTCAVASALRASAILTRVRDRAWVQMY